MRGKRSARNPASGHRGARYLPDLPVGFLNRVSLLAIHLAIQHEKVGLRIGLYRFGIGLSLYRFPRLSSHRRRQLRY